MMKKPNDDFWKKVRLSVLAIAIPAVLAAESCDRAEAIVALLPVLHTIEQDWEK